MFGSSEFFLSPNTRFSSSALFANWKHNVQISGGNVKASRTFEEISIEYKPPVFLLAMESDDVGIDGQCKIPRRQGASLTVPRPDQIYPIPLKMIGLVYLTVALAKYIFCPLIKFSTSWSVPSLHEAAITLHERDNFLRGRSSCKTIFFVNIWDIDSFMLNCVFLEFLSS